MSQLEPGWVATVLAALVLAAMLITPAARADNGTWLGNSGNWSAPGTWSGGTVADGADFTAFFTGINITAAKTITLDTARTIGNITFTDDTTPSANLTISGANILTLDVTSGAPVIDVTQSGRTLTISSPIAGDDGLTKNGAGSTLVLGAANSYTGTTTVNAGTLAFTSTSPFANTTGIGLADTATLRSDVAGASIGAPITLGASGTTATINGSTVAASGGPVYLTLGGAIGGAGNVVFNSSAGNNNLSTIILNAQSIYGGTTKINTTAAGASIFVKLGIANALPTTTELTMDGGNGNGSGRWAGLELNGFNQELAGLTTVARTLRGRQILNTSSTAATLTVNNSTDYLYDGILGDASVAGSGNFGLTKTGAGKLTIGGAFTLGSIPRADSFSGPTTLSNGTLNLNTANVLTNSVLTMSGGTLEFNGAAGTAFTFGGLAAAAAGAGYDIGLMNTFLTAVVLTVGNNNANTTYAGVLSEGGSLIKVGSGKLTFSGANTYSGTTTIRAGTLALSGSGAIASPLIDVQGGVFDVSATGFTLASGNTLQGSGAVNGTVTVATGSAVITAGNGTSGTLTFANLTFSGTGTVNVGTLGNYTSAAAIDVTGTLALGGADGDIMLKLPTVPVLNGTYHLIHFASGTVTTSKFALGTIPALNSRQAAQLQRNGNYLDYVVSGVSDYWTGVQSPEWSVNPITPSQNWTINGTGADYVEGDTVVFDDTATNTTVDISVANVTPNGVTFSNTNKDYTLQGTFGIAGGAALTKTGNGTVTLNNANTYTGGTTISAGTLALGNATDTLADTGAVTVDGATALLSLGANSDTVGAVSLKNGAAITGSGGILSGSSFAMESGGVSANLGGSGALTKTTAGTVTLSGANDYSGVTTVTSGTLNLTGSRVVAPTGPGLGVDVGGASAVLVFGGDFPANTTAIRVGNTTGHGMVNQTNGSVSFSGGDQLALGNGDSGAGNGTYNLSGGTLSTATAVNRGIILGANPFGIGTFNLSGSGTLAMAAGSVLQIARCETGIGVSHDPDTTGIFNQSGGTATVGDLRIGGSFLEQLNTQAQLNLSGGTFAAASFTYLSGGNSSSSTINVSGTADVTLPKFPTTRGVGATASISFDGGTLRPLAASTTYMGGLTSAKIKVGGATLAVGSGTDITITQSLLTDGVSLGGGLTKTGDGMLTLSGTNTYTGVTTVSNGTLRVNGLLSSSAVTVAAGGALSGTGTISNSVALSGTVSPGASVGTLNTGSQTWNGGAACQFELRSATNSAGMDLLNITGTLDVQATSGNQFTVKLVSMSNATTPGLVPDFSGYTSYTWVIATASGGILNFDASKFAIDATAFANAYTGTFSVAKQGNNLVVDYTAPPPLTPPVLDPGTGFGIVDGKPTFTFSTIAGYKYRVVYSEDVSAPLASWLSLPDTPTTDGDGWVVATVSGPMTLRDPEGTIYVQRFYVIEGTAP